jgi:ankyrin repeat protein
VASNDACRSALQSAFNTQAALDAAARAGDAAACSHALAAGAHVSRPCSEGGETALVLAAQAGSAEAVDVLLKAGADVKETDLLGMTALHAAAARGAITAVLPLLSAGADVRATDSRGFNALRHAAVVGHVGCVRALLEAGSPVDRDTYSCAKEPECRYMLLTAVEKVDEELARHAEAALAAKKAAKKAELLASQWT